MKLKKLAPRLVGSLLLLGATLGPAISLAEEHLPLDTAPLNTRDMVSLQRGAQHFVEFCVKCHAAKAQRFSGLVDIGIPEDLIRANFLFPGAKTSAPLEPAMRLDDAKAWFGAVPPDLSVIVRARGADWLYTYLRTFYPDPTRPTGWNNLLYDKVAMPHVLWERQGKQRLVTKTWGDEMQANAAYLAAKASTGKKRLEVEQDGKAVHYKVSWLEAATEDGPSVQQYDSEIADLVNFMAWMSEPHQNIRVQLGYAVLFFLVLILLPFIYLLKKAVWKDVH